MNDTQTSTKTWIQRSNEVTVLPDFSVDVAEPSDEDTSDEPTEKAPLVARQ